MHHAQGGSVLAFALAASPVTEGQVVRIATDDGHEGFGYASATPHMGSTKATLEAELALFRPLLIGRDASGIEAILVGARPRHPRCAAGEGRDRLRAA